MTYKKEEWLDVTGVDLRKLIREVYNLSVPQGLGHLHYTPEGLSDDEVNQILSNTGYTHLAVAMDYVKGRACKMNVYKEDDRLYIPDKWFDHTDEQLVELLKRVGICTRVALYDGTWLTVVTHPLAKKIGKELYECPLCMTRIQRLTGWKVTRLK